MAIPAYSPNPATASWTAQKRTQRGPVTVEWLHRIPDGGPVPAAWRALEARTQGRTVLSTFDYNDTWYRCYAGSEGDALIGLARRNGTLAGVAPLVIRTRHIGKLALRSVEFVPHDAYAGEFLVDDGSPEVAGAFLDSLVQHVRFDVVCLNDIDVTSERHAVLRDVAMRHGLGVEVTDHPNAMVDLSDGYDHYFRQRSTHFRQAIRRMGRRIEDSGATAVEGVVLTRGIDRIDDTVQRMIAITEASHKLRGERLADIHRRFLAGLAQRFGVRGMLALPILRVGDRDAAFVFGLVERGCFFDITLSYDEAFAQLRVGTQLVQELLKELAAHGVHTVISHGAHEYKAHWATTFTPSPRLFLFARTARAIATRMLRFQLAPLWRRLGVPEP